MSFSWVSAGRQHTLLSAVTEGTPWVRNVSCTQQHREMGCIESTSLSSAAGMDIKVRERKQRHEQIIGSSSVWECRQMKPCLRRMLVREKAVLLAYEKGNTPREVVTWI